MKARDIMTEKVFTCRPTDSMADVARTMWEHDCGTVPVVDPWNERLVGMITDRDICLAALTKGTSLPEIRVAEAMAQPFRSCRLGDDVEDLLAAMGEWRVRRMPIVDPEGRVAGIVSLDDLAIKASETRGPLAQSLRNHLVETLAAISRPRPLVQS
jgi:CBS domain-containing protein